jgi:hypothetical protein
VTRFESLGAEARWRTLYDMLKECDIGGVLTYEQMAGALHLRPKADRAAIRSALHRAARELLHVDKRAVEAAPKVGYRVVEAEYHLTLAQRQQKRAGRALRRGHDVVVNVDFNGVTPEVRAGFEVVARAFSLQMDFNRRFDVRQKRLESVVRETGERTERNEAEIAELKQRLARLEQAG